KNFDADGDGLYDSYAAIWASDALQYSGGGVTHSSAYNYRANQEAARLSKLIGEDGKPYEKEAERILTAINNNLWMSDKGWYAEYKDLLGNKLLHPSAGLWTIYHAIDSKVPDAFQAYQTLRYIDLNIPHIPVIAKGWSNGTSSEEEKNLYLLSETNWQPYTWSLNNVVIAENLHTALAYWQGNRREEAFKLWRSVLLETMYLGSGPGNFHQLSFYDAIRGELYRDFADGVGMVARSLMEGLFGIQPDALNKKLVIKPGFPSAWNNAYIKTPDISFDFERSGDKEVYVIKQNTYKHLGLQLIIPALKDNIAEIVVNGKPVKWKAAQNGIGTPSVEINLPAGENYVITVTWNGKDLSKLFFRKEIYKFEKFVVSSKILSGFELYDPQKAFNEFTVGNNFLSAKFGTGGGHKTIFIKTKQGAFTWWQPIDMYIIEQFEISESKPVNEKMTFEKIELTPFFNDAVTNIFRNKYLSPRPTSPTLQLPVTGIGNWAYHSLQVNISDSGLRSVAGIENEFVTSSGIPFQTPGFPNARNIVFTSMWDNYPDSITIPLKGNSSHAYFLMAGTTNPMQSRIVNGEIIINYNDGSSEQIALRNPQNWWPIEQDFYVDGFAFTTDAPRPIRIGLKTGKEIPPDYKYSAIRGFSNFAVDGGAATVLDLPLDNKKQLKNLVLRSVANDVVIGLMGLTLVR
ncbi:MAG TPA: glycogen debranching protein, partial [Chitinophagaceae bacterium]